YDLSLASKLIFFFRNFEKTYSGIQMGSGISWPFLAMALQYLCFISCVNAAAGSRGNETDHEALLHFKSMITSDPLRALSSWNDSSSSSNFCQWQGVTCSRRHQRITVLDLRSLQLSGSVSPYIGNLSFLKELYLVNNSLTKQIPPEIGRLHRLERLLILNNSFSGEIPPALSNCSNLVVFNAANNLLVGSIPSEIGSSLTNLQNFVVSFNRLTGSIPASLGNMSSSLVVLSASNNHLSGEIPTSLSQLKSLSILYLPMNGLSGTIPSSIFNLSSLTYVYFGFNQLRGTLPSDLGISLPNLQSFDVALNYLTGNIPSSFSNASNLEQLQLQGNRFTGRVPDLGSGRNLLRLIINNNSLGTGGINNNNDLGFISSLTNATNLQALIIDQNNFGGNLPSHASNLSALQILYISDNKLSGGFPSAIHNLENLQRLVAFGNRFSGTIPSTIGNLQNLEELDLSNNSFTGNLPSSIGNLTRLLELKLGSNYFQGRIPSSISGCEKLITLDLSHNNFSGEIPEGIMNLVSLSVFLNLSDNNLSGSLPTEVGNLKNLGALDLSRNMLSGIIPSGLGSCVRLESVNLQGNLFQGDIPSSLSSLRGMQELDISGNNLSGQIPKLFESMNLLQVLNLSHNNFEGEVPKGGVFTNRSIVSVVANGKLCGGIADLNLPPCKSFNIKTTLSRKWKIVISTLSSLVFLALVASCLLIFLIKRRGRKEHHAVSVGGDSMSYQRLYKATDGFSSSNLVGVGSFGSVYKGVLHDENEISQITTIVAVKVFNLQRRGASKSFMAECEALKNIRHRNLVRIVTVCSSVDYQGNDFKALIYEFLANGSLEEWLHHSLEEAQPPKMLSFLQRLNAAIDIASAVDYLHHQCGTPIVHCDLKPSNVLLDEDKVAHVSDFGLARILISSVATVLSPSAGQTSSIGVKGTVGYAPPEYGMGNEVSIQGDVYSYGILLLEMFTGKRPTDESFREGLNLHRFVRSALSENRATQVVDPVLHSDLLLGQSTPSSSSSSEQSNKNKGQIPEEVLIAILKIGVICSSDFSQDRISMTDVVSRLVSLRKSLH
ncbi:Probable LRR receptor-like serine/threonine-protein kinase At3g47570, partial [Linum grandiflorum]